MEQLLPTPHKNQVENPTEDAPGSASENPFSIIRPVGQRKIKQIWAIGGGKGGIGKSLLASNFAISLAQQGHRVIAADLDFGGANLHTALGVDLPKQSIADFLGGRSLELGHCVSQTRVPNLEILSGAQDHLGIANLSFADKTKIMNEIQRLNTDYLIIDLGAGTSFNTIDFFLFADVGIVATLPEPTSIENAYRFIKSAYYRKLDLSEDLKEARELIHTAMDPNNLHGIRTPADLYKAINQKKPELALKFKSEIASLHWSLVVNQARTQSDVDLGFSVKSVCKKYFGIEVDYVGYLDYDSAVWQAVRRKRPLVLEFPNSQLSTSIDRMTRHLANLQRNR